MSIKATFNSSVHDRKEKVAKSTDPNNEFKSVKIQEQMTNSNLWQHHWIGDLTKVTIRSDQRCPIRVDGSVFEELEFCLCSNLRNGKEFPRYF